MGSHGVTCHPAELTYSCTEPFTDRYYIFYLIYQTICKKCHILQDVVQFQLFDLWNFLSSCFIRQYHGIGGIFEKYMLVYLLAYLLKYSFSYLFVVLICSRLFYFYYQL